MSWWKNLKGKVRLKEPLRNHTTFKIGGRARYFIEPENIDDLKLLLSLVKRYKLLLFVIGRGSNILVNDKGVDGVVMRLSSPFFKKISFNNNYLKVCSGAMLNQLISLTQRKGLSGLEFLAGIPGTVGGALVMNAGISEKTKNITIGDLVEKVTAVDCNGNIKTLNKKDLKFGYRRSNLSKYIILSTDIKLIRKNKQEIKNKIERYLNYRYTTQDLSRPSAGCVFKNPKGSSAGRLIDLCGLKHKRIGGACISQRHANFILNLGRARSKDVLELMGLIRKKVKKRFNITLEPEIKIWK